MRHLLTAFQFLTPFKIGKIRIVSDEGLAKSMAWFGIVGLSIGIALAGAYLLLNLFLPKVVVSVFIVLLMVIFSRGLHLDGLADTADGIAGGPLAGAGKDKADMLRIMHDPNIGAIGAAAIFICLLLKFGCIYSIQSPVKALIVSSVLSRWAFVFSATKWRPAPDNDGMGSKFIKFAGRKELFWSTLTMFLTAIFMLGFKGIVIVIFAALFISIFNNFIKNKISGLTGDTLGAVGEAVECFSLVVISALTK